MNPSTSKNTLPSNSVIRQSSDHGIVFDARGNAVYRGSLQHLLDNSLMSQQLELTHEESTLDARAMAGSGYNPYEHAASATATERTRKVNMRELSKWIDLKNRIAAQRNSTDDNQ